MTDDLSRSRTLFEQDSTLIAVVELSLSNWVVAGIVPGIDRHPLKKLGADHDALLQLIERWRDEAIKAGRTISRIVLAFEAGRDGFWLARWLKARGIEAFVIHSMSVAVPREHRLAKTDRLDTELLKRAFLGWLRGEPEHGGDSNARSGRRQATRGYLAPGHVTGNRSNGSEFGARSANSRGGGDPGYNMVPVPLGRMGPPFGASPQMLQRPVGALDSASYAASFPTAVGPDFSEHSYGFRPGCSAHQTLAQAQRACCRAGDHDHHEAHGAVSLGSRGRRPDRPACARL